MMDVSLSGLERGLGILLVLGDQILDWVDLPVPVLCTVHIQTWKIGE